MARPRRSELQALRRRIGAAGGEGSSLLRELASAVRGGGAYRPDPPVDGLVMEVGGGQSPHPLADVVVDKYVTDDFERPGEAGISYAKPLVVADGQALPFADGTFAYAIASHVLEHATDPERFAGELGRVARAGFVQVPSRQAELTFGWKYHPWLIDLESDRLVFTARAGERAPESDLFHSAFASEPLLRLWFGAHRERWHHTVEWRARPHVRVDGAGVAEETATVDLDRTVAVLTAAAERGVTTPLPPALREALRCPACGGRMADDGATLRCEDCARSHPLAGHTPILLS